MRPKNQSANSRLKQRETETMHKKTLSVFVVFCISILCFGASCSTSDAGKVSCLSERARQTTIRWGDYDVKSGKMRAYQFSGSLKMSTVERESFGEQPEINDFDKIEGEVFCKWLEKTVSIFEKIQTLNAPGDEARYVEYSTAKTTVRAVWNPKYQTYGSKEFRAFYDSLTALVPEKERRQNQ